MKNQKGITLIALIITIIVMLILVGVSVTVALNGGLFKTAKQASEKTEEKRDEELALSDGKVNVNGKLYNSMDEYVNGEKWTQNETTITKGDTTLEIGQIVTGYDAGVEDWDGEWAVLGVEDGKLLLVSTKSVAYTTTTDESGATTKTYGVGTIPMTDGDQYKATLMAWCAPFGSSSVTARPLMVEDLLTELNCDSSVIASWVDYPAVTDASPKTFTLSSKYILALNYISDARIALRLCSVGLLYVLSGVVRMCWLA